MPAVKLPLKIGIVGMGKMGALRLAHLKSDPRCIVSAICDVDPNRLNPFNGQEFQVFTDYADLLKFPLDVIFVCVPNAISASITSHALRGKRHVFCEKPPGRNMQDVLLIKDAAQAASGCKLKFGFNHRYHEGIREAKAIIESNRFGKILWIRGIYGKAGGFDFETSWRNNRAMSGGGILLDQGIHMLDLFRFFCGNFYEIKSYVTKSFWNIDVEDNAFALLKNDLQQVAMLHSSSTHWRHQFSLEIFLTEGYVGVNGILSQSGNYGPERLITARRVRDDAHREFKNPCEQTAYFDTDVSWQLEINEFLDAIINEKPIQHGTLQDGLEVMRMVEGVYAADESWVELSRHHAQAAPAVNKAGL